jgi:hypothetical protein
LDAVRIWFLPLAQGWCERLSSLETQGEQMDTAKLELVRGTLDVLIFKALV